jgi:hypothetical protein
MSRRIFGPKRGKRSNKIVVKIVYEDLHNLFKCIQLVLNEEPRHKHFEDKGIVSFTDF